MTDITELARSLLEWAGGSSAAATSLGLNVIMFTLTLAGFGMYFQQKRQYRLLFEMLESFDAAKRIQQEKAVAAKEHKALREELTSAREEMELRLPNEARRAYYLNAIPSLQEQMFNLAKQLEGMEKGLASCGEQLPAQSPTIDAILSREVRQHLEAKREMDQSQTLLAVYTGSVAAVGILLPYPLSLLAVPLALAAIRLCFRIYGLWKLVNRATSRDESTPNTAARHEHSSRR